MLLLSSCSSWNISSLKWSNSAIGFLKAENKQHYRMGANSEAITYTGSLNRAQQAFYLENGRFASTIEDLNVGITDTQFHDFEIESVSSDQAIVTATAKEDGIKSFTGITYTLTINGRVLTRARVCETEHASRTPPPCYPDSP